MDDEEALKEPIEEKLLPVAGRLVKGGGGCSSQVQHQAREDGGMCGPLHSLQACNINLLVVLAQHAWPLCGANGYSSFNHHVDRTDRNGEILASPNRVSFKSYQEGIE